MSHLPSYPAPHPAAQPARTPSRVLPALGVAFGLLGLIAGVGAWFRPVAKPEAPVYSAEQVEDAKKAVCAAYTKGVRSFQIAGNRKVENPADVLPVAVNTRLAEIGVGNYLTNAVEANPAAPAELGEAVRRLADAYQEIALTQLAEGTASDYRSVGRAADATILRIDQMCQ